MQEKEQDDDNMEFFHVHNPKRKDPKQPAKQEEKNSQCRPRSKAPIRDSALDLDKLKSARISSELIVNEAGSNTDTLINSITCPVCLMILPIPYQECQSCSNGFCDSCIQSWWAKSPNTCIFKCDQAEFKLIKRSNTYNALMQTLKVACEHCEATFAISDMQNHYMESCQEIQQTCRFCGGSFKRKDIQSHETDQCVQRIYECPHCCLAYLSIERHIHEGECSEKELSCQHQGCDKLTKRKDIETHQSSCEMRKTKCQWCEQSMPFKEYEIHDLSCEKKKVACEWCSEGFGVRQILMHDCPEKREVCRLCEEEILCSSMNVHKGQCVFDRMVEMKRNEEALMMDNARLKEKIALLESLLEQSIESRQSSTLKVMRDMREEQKKTIEKDLLRIDNSMKSVEKLKQQEIAAHMKYPHLIQSWCPICRELEKKFRIMLEPLVTNRKLTLQKLADFEKFNCTPKPK